MYEILFANSVITKYLLLIRQLFFVAKKLDKRLSDLGATAVIDRGLGDDQHPSGYEAALDPWMASLWSRLSEIKPNFFLEGPDFLNVELIGQPKFQVSYHNVDNMDSQLLTAGDIEYLVMQIGRARSMSAGRVSHEKSKPDAFLKMINNYPLTRASHEKDVRHLEFEFLSQVIQYEVGDVLEVLPSQNPAAVDSFLQRCNLDPESFITVLTSKD
ncbi:FAD-binding, type 1 [Corchorus olitorius]|uniref:FAD-binding, type 1 n=1 Tax=Corchorus olitorius TaxID=93759 RepID=A0A1R3I3V8_9ROSI|nr:FAD-binding, type 1 [Corchorus olitorius]